MKTADAVLCALSKPETADGFISGEALADLSGVSRQAVWKAVKRLRLMGARIEAVTNRGYRLSGAGGILSEKAVASLIDEALHVRVFVYQKIDSTNTEAKRRLAETSDVRSLDHTVIVASSQTAGRGRLGRAFYSPDGSGLYLSIIYAPNEKIESPALLASSLRERTAASYLAFTSFCVFSQASSALALSFSYSSSSPGYNPVFN